MTASNALPLDYAIRNSDLPAQAEVSRLRLGAGVDRSLTRFHDPMEPGYVTSRLGAQGNVDRGAMRTVSPIAISAWTIRIFFSRRPPPGIEAAAGTPLHPDLKRRVR
jgi:hypothetical protein